MNHAADPATATSPAAVNPVLDKREVKIRAFTSIIPGLIGDIVKTGNWTDYDVHANVKFSFSSCDLNATGLTTQYSCPLSWLRGE